MLDSVTDAPAAPSFGSLSLTTAQTQNPFYVTTIRRRNPDARFQFSAVRVGIM